VRFGAHVSIREGYYGAAKRAAALGGAAFQYFPKNPRSLTIKQYNREDAQLCKQFCLDNGLVSIAHTPYPTSLTPSIEKREIIIQSLLNDLEIAQACGSIGVVVHFGNEMNPKNPLEGYQLMIEILNSVLENWHDSCFILIENMAGLPGKMGTTMEELVQVRNLTNYPEKIGFCFDTCHAFASSLWTGENGEEWVRRGSDLGYFEHLKAIHLNNSKYPVGSGKDRHANIFHNGYIQETYFDGLIRLPILSEIPFILETPSDLGISHEEELRVLKEKWGD
jgi:deoxyribonuclease IV